MDKGQQRKNPCSAMFTDRVKRICALFLICLLPALAVGGHLEEKLARLKKKETSADALEKQEKEREIAALAKELLWTKENGKTILTKEEFGRVKERMSHTYILDIAQMPEYSEKMLSLLSQLASKGLPLEQFIIEANQTLALIEGEREEK